MRMAAKGQRYASALFEEFTPHPEQLPERVIAALEQRKRQSGSVCDYLAGMTDRYAQDEYLRLFQPYTSV